MTINIIKPPNPPPYFALSLTLDVPGNQIINQKPYDVFGYNKS